MVFGLGGVGPRVVRVSLEPTSFDARRVPDRSESIIRADQPPEGIAYVNPDPEYPALPPKPAEYPDAIGISAASGGLHEHSFGQGRPRHSPAQRDPQSEPSTQQTTLSVSEPAAGTPGDLVTIARQAARRAPRLNVTVRDDKGALLYSAGPEAPRMTLMERLHAWWASL